MSSARITEIIGSRCVEGLIDRGETYPCDLIINATGMVPNAEIAHRAGLKIGSKGGIVSIII